jgi:hypothetical protein
VDRVTVAQAARILGIKEESVRKRVSRGTLRADKDEDGRLLVYVDSPGTVRDEYTDQSVTDRDELVAELRRTNELLREVITTRDEEIRRRDVIISQLTSRIPELEGPTEAQESPESSGPAGALGEVLDELGDERTRRETAERTLREGMDEQRRRREQAERERDELRREVYALTELREATQIAEEQQGRGPPRPATGEAQEPAWRRWRRRWFGG